MTQNNQPNEVQGPARNGPPIGQLIDHPLPAYALATNTQPRPLALRVTRGANGAPNGMTNVFQNRPTNRPANNRQYLGGWSPDPWVQRSRWRVPDAWCMYQQRWVDTENQR